MRSWDDYISIKSSLWYFCCYLDVCRWMSWMRLSWRTWWTAWSSSCSFPVRRPLCPSQSESPSPSLVRCSCWISFLTHLLTLLFPGWWNGLKGKCLRIRSSTPSCWRPIRGWSRGNVWLSSRNFLEMSLIVAQSCRRVTLSVQHTAV